MNGGKQKQRGKYSDAYVLYTYYTELRNKHDSQSTVDPGDSDIAVPGRYRYSTFPVAIVRNSEASINEPTKDLSVSRL